jgi:fibronectin-binding autotransporter adhesin
MAKPAKTQRFLPPPSVLPTLIAHEYSCMKSRSASHVLPLFRSSSLFRQGFATLMMALLCLPMQGATTITFTDGQTDNTNYDTSGANNPTTLTIASGTATSSGVLSGTGSVFKTGAGTLILAGANNYSGGTTVNAGLLEVTLGGAISHASANTFIGNGGGDDGTLSITGGTVGNASALIGGATGAKGTANVSGGSWSSSGSLIVGNLGTGLLNLSGGTVSNTTGTVGSLGGSSGTATVSGGSWINSSSLTVGAVGTGVLNLSGGSITSVGGTLGGTSGSQGTVTVSGGSWVNSGSFFIGSSGTGVLTITSGSLSSGVSTIASAAGSSGTVNVSGGSWTSSTISVGASGTGVLNVSGGSVSNALVGVGSLSGASGTVNVSAGNWTISTLNIGVAGTGALNLSGGSISSASSTLGLSGGSSGTATVSGGRWTSSGLITVGSSGTGVLNLSGGSISSVGTTLGTNSGSSGAATVSGTGTVWINSSSLTVGSAGTGGLTIADGGLVSAPSLNGGNGSSSVNFDGGTLRITATDTATNTINLLAGGGVVDVPTAGTTFTITSSLSGVGGLGKSGAGTLTLTGAHGYLGGTTITGGTLQLGSGTVDGTIYGSAGIALNGGTLYFNNLGAQSYGGSFSRATGAVLSLRGGGTFTSTMTGLTANNAAGIIGAWASFGTGSATRYATFSGSSIVGLTGTAAATAANLTDTTGLVNYDLASAVGTMPAVVSANTVRYTGGAGTTSLGADSFSVNGLMNAGTGTWTLGSNTLTIGAEKELVINAANAGITISSVIADNGGGASALTKTGAGTLMLSGVNSYSGATYLNAGVLNVNSGAALGSGGAGNVLVFNGGTLQAGQSFSSAATRGILLTSNGVVDSNSAEVVLAGVISGAGGLTKSSVGTLALTGTNTYTGVTTISAGALSVATIGNGGEAGNLGAAGSSAANLVLGGGTLRYMGASAGSDRGFTLALSSNSTIEVTDGATNLTFSGAVTGAGGLIKSGAGTLTLAGVSSATGTTTVSAGTLVLDFTAANSSKLYNSGGLTLRSAVLQLDRAVGASGSHVEVVSATTLTGGAAITRGAGSTALLRMNVITRNAGSTLNFDAAGIADTDTLNTNGILGAGWATAGGTDWAMNSTNGLDGLITAYSGYTDVTRQSSGVKVIADAATSNVRIVEGVGGGAASLTLGSAVTTINTLNQSASGGTGAALINTAGQTLGVNGILVGSGAGALTVGTADASRGTLRARSSGGELIVQNFGSGVLTINANVVNNVSASALTHAGSGTTVLAGSSSYTGATTVVGGTLEVSGGGAITATSAVTLDGGGLTVGGSTAGGVSSTGALTVGNYTAGTLTILTGGSVGNTIGVLGNQIGSSGTANVSGGSWTNSSSLYVGSGGMGELNVSSGSVSNTFGWVGNAAGSLGTATVSGGSWSNSAFLHIGYSGTGVLNVSGGTVSNTTGFLGYLGGSSGTANVSGGSWTSSGALYVGYNGSGVLNVSGGSVSNTAGWVGNFSGSTGTANVSSGSWTNSSTLAVGNAGIGILNINGGTVSNSIALLGSGADANGTVNVSSGSWISSALLYVGQFGTGVLNVSGGSVSNTTAYLGSENGSTGTANVNGGSWSNSSSLTIGNLGAGVLNLTGGTVTAGGGAGTVTLGSAGTLNMGVGGTVGTLSAATVTSGSSTAKVNFNHTGSQTFVPNLTGSLAVTKLGAGITTLTGTNSYSGTTTITAGTLRINGNQTAANGAVTVQTGATLGGTGGIGGAITVQNGATLAPGNSIGTLNGTSATFEGGSLFALEGGGAFFDRLNLSGAATIESGAMISFAISSLLTEISYTLLTADSGLDGSTAFTLSGNVPADYGLIYTGTALLLKLLDPEAAFWAGDESTAWSSFDARDTNWVTTQDGSTDTGALPGSTTAVTFTATGATNLSTVLDDDFTIQSLTVNNTVAIGGEHTLTVTGDTQINSGGLTLHSGATLAGSQSLIGTGVDDSASVTVTGEGTQWTSSGDLNVGFEGKDNTLSVEDKAVVTANYTKIGGYVSSTGNAVTVTGAGSQLNTTNSLIVGYGGDGNRLTLQNGGAATNVDAFIGFRFDANSTSDENAVTVTGSGSLWTNTGTLHLGDYGSDNTLTISAGGKVTVNGSGQDALIGAENGADGNKLSVTGAGSEFSNESTFYIGNKGDSNTLEVLDGGLVTSKNVRIGGDALSSGNTATVDGAGSIWNISGTQLRIGDAGDSNTLNITDGGVVNVLTGLTVLGRQSTSDGNSVLITGTDSKLSTVNLTIGRDGTNNTVTVAAGGNVTATGSVIIAENLNSSGTLKIGDGETAGSVTATSISGGLGTATVAFDHTDDISFDPQITGSASLTKDGAGITNLTASSTYTGTTNVNAGALAVTGSLSGGADITVASNAILTGDGSITTAVDQSIFLNGTLSVQNVGSLNAATFSVTTSGTGSMVMGPGSVIAVDLLTGTGLGDNTATLGASDALSLTGTLDATAGGTLLLGNPNVMTGYASGDKWLVVDLNGGDGSITGTLGFNDASLGLSGTQVGSFDQTTGVYTVVDTVGGLQTAAAQDQSVLSTIQNALGDINGRLFNLRSGGGEEGSDGSIASSIDDGVIMGFGDGPEETPVAKKVLRSRQWEVYTTVNYANVSLSSIGTQAGVDAQTWSPSVGIERHLSRGLAIGFAVSLLETHQEYASNLGNLDIQGIGISTYASYVRSAFWVDALYSFGMLSLESTRNPGIGLPTAEGDTDAITNTVQFNGGWNFRFQNNTLVTGPFAGLDYTHVAVDGYSENGGGIAALAYGRRDFDSLVSRLGWSVSKKFVTSHATITPQLRVSYERQNITNNNATSASLVNLPFTATTQGQSPGQDYMVVGTGVNFAFNDQLSLLLTYQVQLFRQDMQAHFAGLRLSYQF